MNVLALIIFLLVLLLFDRIDKKIVASIKERMGESWKKHRFLFVAIHLFVLGLGLAVSLCAFSLIRGNVPPVLLILKCVLVVLTIAFVSAMLVASVVWFLRALSKNKNEASSNNAYHKHMKKAFLFLFLFAIGSVVLVLEYQFLL